jgi:uncharacterized membrane protein
MSELIEPNWHPLVVHFVIAFLLTSPVLLLIAAFSPPGARYKTSLQAAGDWMLALGVIAAILAVAAGLQAYYSVAHDTPSHEAMTNHRNYAFATVALFGVFAVWRFATRASAPAKLFGVLFLAATLLLATTAWKGGRLVYHYGLGVKSLPAAEGEGHDHDHGTADDHGDDHDDGDHADDHDDDHDDGDDHEHAEDQAPSPASASELPADFSALEPAEVVDAFQAALASGNEDAVRPLLAPNVIIAEGGGAERSLEEYAGHHMPADMAFTAAVEFSLKKRDAIVSGDMATVISEMQTHGSFNGREIHSRMMETMVLRQGDNGWKIVHIHWSSAPITGEHEH